MTIAPAQTAPFLLTPRARKLGLTLHLVASLGWLGGVAAFLVLSVAGLTSHAIETVRAAYLAMNLTGEFVIVPLSLAALLTGVIQSLGTPWGLLRYYWVLVKFALTIGATALLLLHQFTAVAEAARRVTSASAERLPEAGGLGAQLVGDAVAAIVVLLIATVLAVYKPWGRTPYGVRKEQAERSNFAGEATLSAERAGLPLSLKLVIALVGLMAAGFAVLHHLGGGLHHHGH